MLNISALRSSIFIAGSQPPFLVEFALGFASLVTRHSSLTIGWCPPCSRRRGHRRREGTESQGSCCPRAPCMRSCPRLLPLSVPCPTPSRCVLRNGRSRTGSHITFHHITGCGVSRQGDEVRGKVRTPNQARRLLKITFLCGS